jgi:hypothetical protein
VSETELENPNSSFRPSILREYTTVCSRLLFTDAQQSERAVSVSRSAPARSQRIDTKDGEILGTRQVTPSYQPPHIFVMRITSVSCQSKPFPFSMVTVAFHTILSVTGITSNTLSRLCTILACTWRKNDEKTSKTY